MCEGNLFQFFKFLENDEPVLKKSETKKETVMRNSYTKCLDINCLFALRSDASFGHVT